jgi:hypothetical protein
MESLCGHWLFSGERFDTMHDNRDNCMECRRKRDRLAEKEGHDAAH